MMLNNSHLKTLEQIFDKPTRSNVSWRSTVKLFVALGGEVSEGKGSRIRVYFRQTNKVAVFHRPHPGDEMRKSLVKSVCKFLCDIGVEPS